MMFGVVVGLAAGSVSAFAGNDQAAVRKVFERYTQGLQAKDGKNLARLVDSATLAYYARMGRAALRAPRAKVKRMKLIDKLMVLSLRSRLNARQLRSLTGRSLFARVVDLGMVSAGAGRRAGIGTVSVHGKHATAPVLSRGKPSPLRWSFVKERGHWRMQLLPLMKVAEPALRAGLRRLGKSEDEALMMIVGMLAKKKLTEAIWDPPSK